MRVFLRLLFAPCREMSRQTSLAFDQELPRSHRVAIHIHCLYCTACRRYRKHIRFIREALSRLSDDEGMGEAVSDLWLPPDARERIKASLDRR